MKPNIVLVVADDMRADTLEALPTVRRWSKGSGMSWPNGFVVNPVCGSSRASILTGTYPGTNGVWGNNPPDGGYEALKLVEDETIAVKLQDAGYVTAMVGKYTNGYDPDNAAERPPGWDEWWAITASGDKYYDYSVSDNGTLRKYGKDPHEYLTDVIAANADKFLASASEPFFAYVCPSAPHKQAIPADRHQGAWSGLKPHTPPSLNEEDVSDKPQWLQDRQLLSEGRLASQRTFRKNQYRTLGAVDDLCYRIETTLLNRRALRRTVLIFCSDNGYLWGEHRLVGKSVPYLEATRMPLVVLPAAESDAFSGASTQAVVSNIDLAPTIADLAGVPFPADGVPIQSLKIATPTDRESVFVAHGVQPGSAAFYVPAFGQVQAKHYTFTLYATGETEYYDLRVDPWQVTNAAPDNPERVAAGIADVLSHFDATGYPPGWGPTPRL